MFVRFDIHGWLMAVVEIEDYRFSADVVVGVTQQNVTCLFIAPHYVSFCRILGQIAEQELKRWLGILIGLEFCLVVGFARYMDDDLGFGCSFNGRKSNIF